MELGRSAVPSRAQTRSWPEEASLPSVLANARPLRYLIKKDRYSSHSVILAGLGEGRGRLLLDLGAAQGDMAELLTSQGFVVTAVEGDPVLAEMARKKCAETIVADLDQPLPHFAQHFDVVLCADVLEHLKDPERVLREAVDRLKPGGIAAISVPNVAHLWMRLQLLLGSFNYRDRGILDRTHLRFFTLRSFRNLLADSGLKTVEMSASPVPLPLVVPERYHGRLLNTVHAASAALVRLWKSMFAYQFIAFARKQVNV